MLTVTDNAVKRFKILLQEKSGENCGIRIFTAGGGCCGPSIAMDIADKAEGGDETLDNNGLKIFLEKEAVNLLGGATIDFSDNEGFIITGMPRSSCCS
jgi:iron-sulfur cluster assembly accessory protein